MIETRSTVSTAKVKVKSSLTVRGLKFNDCLVSYKLIRSESLQLIPFLGAASVRWPVSHHRA